MQKFGHTGEAAEAAIAARSRGGEPITEAARRAAHEAAYWAARATLDNYRSVADARNAAYNAAYSA